MQALQKKCWLSWLEHCMTEYNNCDILYFILSSCWKSKEDMTVEMGTSVNFSTVYALHGELEFAW